MATNKSCRFVHLGKVAAIVWRCCAGIAAVVDIMLCCLKEPRVRPGVGLWDIEGGLQGPALRRSEMGELYPALVPEED
uniref:Uncharacterized protein n=1 Tax=Physcomitrium patens TaxID=3218 RepID=A0A2K1K858_PHYPA|nr:hypothetical protein PHYPA_011859 [Physcomitrium patens]